jgi:uncharacterized protein YndB with AHSA1/START domain
MTTNADSGERTLSSLGSANGKGVVRIEERYATNIDDLWSAITEPARLARWWGKVEGELRPGGTFHLVVEWEGSGRVEACEPPRRLHVTIRESDESYRKGNGVPPFDAHIDVTLSAAGDETMLVAEVRGMPLDKIAFYGTGWQIHAENLANYVAGRERGDVEPRWEKLLPVYQELAAEIAKS